MCRFAIVGYQATNTVSCTLVAYNIIGASLSKCGFNGLSGAGCHGVSYAGRTSILASGAPGTKFMYTCHITHTVWQRPKWLLIANISNFSCGALQMIITSNNTTYSSSPFLPTINDLCCKIGNTSNMVYVLQFQDSLQRGWLKHSNS